MTCNRTEKHLKPFNDNIVPSIHEDDKTGSDMQRQDGNKIKHNQKLFFNLAMSLK